MSQEHKAEVFNGLATNVEAYAWVTSTLLKEKYGTIDDEEEFKKIEQEVAEYMESDEFKIECAREEAMILNRIATIALNELKGLENVYD